MNSFSFILSGTLRGVIPAALAFATAAAEAGAQVVVTAPTTQWSAVSYGSNHPDPSRDEQATSVDSDIIGNAANPAFYKAFWNGGSDTSRTDGEMGFRVRLAGDKNPSGFSDQMFAGFDLNGNGSLDLFLGTTSSTMTLRAAGAGANTSPSTTTISNSPLYSANVTASTYNWSPVTAALDPSATGFNLDGGSGGGSIHTDHFLSFKIGFQDFVNAAAALGYVVNDSTPFSMVFATATQANSLNQDLGGVSGSVSSSLTWATLGTLSATYSAASSVPVPEPSAPLLGLTAAAGMLLQLRRQTA